MARVVSSQSLGKPNLSADGKQKGSLEEMRVAALFLDVTTVFPAG